jgi:hypothetical protein
MKRAQGSLATRGSQTVAGLPAQVPAYRHHEQVEVVAPCGPAGLDGPYKPVCAGSRPDLTALTSAS